MTDSNPILQAFLQPWAIALWLNTLLMAIAIVVPKKLLTPAGLVHAWGLGVLVWATLGPPGYIVVMVYFLFGSGVTRLGLAQKKAAGIAEKRDGARGPENVWGSALTGALCGLLTLALPPSWHPLLWLGYVASFSTKLSDTCASEVGKAYGKRTFLITTLRPVPPGTEGAMSVEGTLAGFGGAAIIGLVGWWVGLISPWAILVCIGAAFLANLLESWIGATFQDTYPWLTNEVVNGINTTAGAALAMAIALTGLF
ncbi:TIGR00297 family protein [Candidatus Synechococcus calcipolaris G9]|uniref:TIGR00297 family protein n=1 Tax=Candidatus Synechococcus calcipolaris G9 TaxID=1497997 RepID=A0ABT6F388_9SYNE|nr:TIGR00297 family protein [Candidatus Synechococcus calcipolaris]MDG2992320.1 TIGR00297 family protein [Candidatus Synechococcus calcipolaris G9]